MNQQISSLHIKATHTPNDVISDEEKLIGQLKNLIADAEGNLNKVCVVFLVKKECLNFINVVSSVCDVVL
jgi:hypothetical protein